MIDFHEVFGRILFDGVFAGQVEAAVPQSDIEQPTVDDPRWVKFSKSHIDSMRGVAEVGAKKAGVLSLFACGELLRTYSVALWYLEIVKARAYVASYVDYYQKAHGNIVLQPVNSNFFIVLSLLVLDGQVRDELGKDIHWRGIVDQTDESFFMGFLASSQLPNASLALCGAGTRWGGGVCFVEYKWYLGHPHPA